MLSQILGSKWMLVPLNLYESCLLKQIIGVSYGSAHKALKTNLHLHPYKVSVLQHLRGNHFEQRLNYCNWFNETFHEEDLNGIFFSDEAWIHLSGYINSQNYRTWSTENPHVFVENTLHPIKVGVWLQCRKDALLDQFSSMKQLTQYNTDNKY